MSLKIGPWQIDSPLVLAPMAGITDRPFRALCRQMGAGLAVSEMVTSETRLWKSRKTSSRLSIEGEREPVSIQIAGNDPIMMAEAARENELRGAQIIDINMGCPAKKVCNKAAGSALLRDELLVRDIIQAVVESVQIPVTLKIRTGWDRDNRNALSIAQIAEHNGIQALSIHGRTRADGFKGEAEYETIRQVNLSTRLPVIANGDITGPKQARDILDETGVAAIMIGRGALGRPWIFREIRQFLETGDIPEAPDSEELHQLIPEHIQAIHDFYGEVQGVRIARKHIGWYLRQFADGERWRRRIVRLDNNEEQMSWLSQSLDSLLGKKSCVA
jgi:tRNA-dihydrouridine synthase B